MPRPDPKELGRSDEVESTALLCELQVWIPCGRHDSFSCGQDSRTSECFLQQSRRNVGRDLAVRSTCRNPLLENYLGPLP